MRHGFPGFFPWLIHLGFTVAVIIGLALLIAYLLKRNKGGFRKHQAGQPQHGWHHQPPPFGPQPFTPPPPADALRILDERLARGEIEVDDYFTRKTALLGESPNGTVYKPTDQSAPGNPEPDAPTTPGEVPNEGYDAKDPE